MLKERFFYLTLKGVKPVRYKWIFVQKQNKNGEIVRYKTRLVAQGFSQKNMVLIYEETYSIVLMQQYFDIWLFSLHKKVCVYI